MINPLSRIGKFKKQFKNHAKYSPSSNKIIGSNGKFINFNQFVRMQELRNSDRKNKGYVTLNNKIKMERLIQQKKLQFPGNQNLTQEFYNKKPVNGKILYASKLRSLQQYLNLRKSSLGILNKPAEIPKLRPPLMQKPKQTYQNPPPRTQMNQNLSNWYTKSPPTNPQVPSRPARPPQPFGFVQNEIQRMKETLKSPVKLTDLQRKKQSVMNHARKLGIPLNYTESIYSNGKTANQMKRNLNTYKTSLAFSSASLMSEMQKNVQKKQNFKEFVKLQGMQYNKVKHIYRDSVSLNSLKSNVLALKQLTPAPPLSPRPSNLPARQFTPQSEPNASFLLANENLNDQHLFVFNKNTPFDKIPPNFQHELHLYGLTWNLLKPTLLQNKKEAIIYIKHPATSNKQVYSIQQVKRIINRKTQKHTAYTTQDLKTTKPTVEKRISNAKSENQLNRIVFGPGYESKMHKLLAQQKRQTSRTHNNQTITKMSEKYKNWLIKAIIQIRGNKSKYLMNELSPLKSAEDLREFHNKHKRNIRKQNLSHFVQTKESKILSGGRAAINIT